MWHPKAAKLAKAYNNDIGLLENLLARSEQQGRDNMADAATDAIDIAYMASIDVDGNPTGRTPYEQRN